MTIDNAPLSNAKKASTFAVDCKEKDSPRPAAETNALRAINCTTFAINCTAQGLLQSYLSASLADSSKRAYAADIKAFADVGGEIPSSPEAVASYLASQAASRTPATLGRRLVAIGKAHTAQGMANPCESEIVRATLRGIRRTHGTAQRRVDPLLREDLLLVLPLIPESTKGIRDRALLLIGFASAMRRSELADIAFGDLRFVAEGLVVNLRKSKTDQESAGRDIGIPYGRSRACPVKALKAWLDHADISAGPVFRSIKKGGHIQTDAMTGQSVAILVKEYAEAAGLDPTRFAGHSLRAGLITSAAKAGVSSWKLRQQSGHQSETMLARYIRDGDLFIDNAAGAVL